MLFMILLLGNCYNIIMLFIYDIILVINDDIL